MNLLLATLVAIGTDILSGTGASLYKRTFKSSTMREGLVHKATELGVIGFTFAINYLIPEMSGTIGLALNTTTLTYILLMECGSIYENVCVLNPNLKKLFKNKED